MFKVNEMMGNTSKDVAMFETEDEANEYLLERFVNYCENNEVERDGTGFATEGESELFYSYFSIEDDKRELIDEARLEEMYCDALDEEGEIKIGYLTFYPSNVLEKCDPIAYSCGLSDFYDSISDQYYCEGME